MPENTEETTYILPSVPQIVVTQRLAILFGFLAGFFTTYYFVEHFYPYTGCICLLGIHWHHLYSGLMIMGFFLVYYSLQDKRDEKVVLWLLFFAAIGLGMAAEDIFAHFIFALDPWEWTCGYYCSQIR